LKHSSEYVTCEQHPLGARYLLWRIACSYCRSEINSRRSRAARSGKAIELSLVPYHLSWLKTSGTTAFITMRFPKREECGNVVRHEIGCSFAFCSVHIVFSVYTSFISIMLSIRWRKLVFTANYLGEWLEMATNHYRMQLQGEAADTRPA